MNRVFAMLVLSFAAAARALAQMPTAEVISRVSTPGDPRNPFEPSGRTAIELETFETWINLIRLRQSRFARE